jgi:hypothetical protein
VTVAGGWAGLLIFYRVFSRPAGDGLPVGIEWGFFLAFVAAGSLAFAGWRMRAGERPGPPLRRSRSTHRPVPPEPDATIVLGTPARSQREPAETREPALTREPGAAPEPRPAHDPAPTREPPVDGSRRSNRGRYPPAPPGQLSFEDPKARTE